MKVVLISDSHGQHHHLELPPGDLLVHAGDFTPLGKAGQAKDFLPGSPPSRTATRSSWPATTISSPKRSRTSAAPGCPTSRIYLEDQLPEVEGLRIPGSPITPGFSTGPSTATAAAEICSNT